MPYTSYHLDFAYPLKRAIVLYNKNRPIARFTDPAITLQLGKKMVKLSKELLQLKENEDTQVPKAV